MEVNLQIFGGRGGASSGGGLTSAERKSVSKSLDDINIPSMQSFNLPKLQGTPNQVAWANEIRRDVLPEIAHYAQTRNSDGKPTGVASIMAKGKKAMIDDINNNPLVRSTSGAVRKQKIQNAVDSYRDMARRIDVVQQIASHTSAKYWIDRRRNSTLNHQLQRWKKAVDGKL